MADPTAAMNRMMMSLVDASKAEDRGEAEYHFAMAQDAWVDVIDFVNRFGFMPHVRRNEDSSADFYVPPQTPEGRGD